MPVQVNRLARHVRIAAERPLPERMTQHGDGLASSFAVILFRDKPARCGFYSQNVEVISGNELAGHALNERPLGEAEPCAGFGNDSGKALQLFSIIQVVGIAHIAEQLPGLPSLKCDQLVRPR